MIHRKLTKEPAFLRRHIAHALAVAIVGLAIGLQRAPGLSRLSPPSSGLSQSLLSVRSHSHLLAGLVFSSLLQKATWPSWGFGFGRETAISAIVEKKNTKMQTRATLISSPTVAPSRGRASRYGAPLGGLFVSVRGTNGFHDLAAHRGFGSRVAPLANFNRPGRSGGDRNDVISGRENCGVAVELFEEPHGRRRLRLSEAGGRDDRAEQEQGSANE
jgi:hypothetical protein